MNPLFHAKKMHTTLKMLLIFIYLGTTNGYSIPLSFLALKAVFKICQTPTSFNRGECFKELKKLL